MAKGATSMWKTVLQIALAVMFIIGGLNVFMNAGKGFNQLVGATGDPLVTAVSNLFNRGTLRDIIVYVLAAVELIAGVLLILDFFNIKSLDKLDDIFLAIIMICWVVVFIVLGDIVGLFKNGIEGNKILPFLVSLAKNCIMVSAMGIVKAKI
ncbi:MAG: DoxX family membrane protein [Spirochaetaceae bacterium]|nr:DoxX family membrane protein [Spirochaetaceae bacterium]